MNSVLFVETRRQGFPSFPVEKASTMSIATNVDNILIARYFFAFYNGSAGTEKIKDKK